MCEIKLDQGDSRRVLAVGHKVLYEGHEATITGIRVWHDLDTMVGPPHRLVPVCDLQGEFGGHWVNIRIDELEMWHPPVVLPTATATPGK